MTEYDGRGVLYPARLPSFHRVLPDEGTGHLSELVRWFWIPEWDLAPGRTSRQELLPFPATNLVVEPEQVGFSGPATRRSHRDLSGRGWAVGALLRPAAVPLLTDDPGAVRDDYRQLVGPDVPGPSELGRLHRAVVAAMADDRDPQARRAAAVAALGDWLLEQAPPPDEPARLANAMADLVDADPGVLRVEQVAERLGVSVRTVQRLARRYVGLSPAAMIRRRRLQEAAERLRTHPGTDLAAVAAQLGYADQAHLAADFRTVLGFTPSAYRGEHRQP